MLLFSNDALLYIHQKSWTVSTEILNRTNVYNTDNNKCYVSTKSAYWNDFRRIMWQKTVEDFRKIQLCYQE